VKSKQKIVFVWIVDPKSSKPAKSKQKSGISNYKICEIQAIKNRFFVWIYRIFERIWEIQIIMSENPNKKEVFLFFGFSPILYLSFPDFSSDLNNIIKHHIIPWFE
jgi:hypothetical protein